MSRFVRRDLLRGALSGAAGLLTFPSLSMAVQSASSPYRRPKLKIADMAHTHYVPFAPHCVVSPIGTMASCHVCAAVPNFLVLEWHWIQRLELWRNFVQQGEIIEKGFVTLPDRPGLGVDMNEEAVRKAQVPGSTWFEPTKGATR